MRIAVGPIEESRHGDVGKSGAVRVDRSGDGMSDVAADMRVQYDGERYRGDEAAFENVGLGHIDPLDRVDPDLLFCRGVDAISQGDAIDAALDVVGIVADVEAGRADEGHGEVAK